MAASLNENVRKSVKESKILVVGAGGIGCELLKNLVLTGFTDIEVIDLDTIDVSNLNRQFLFRKEHVGKSKSQVAKESALKFNPDANIVAYHDNVKSDHYGADFYKKFKIVMNALDNRDARNHVNRMCLAADIPLIESGTAGYLGQVTVIKKGITECYECQPKPAQKTYPGCTIRNTPSEPIHCIVWAKHLFNQLFGELDPDEEVSPDTADPELAGEAGQSALETEAKEDVAGGIERQSTRTWAMETGYDPQKLFNKFFRDDIKYLLSMETLWKKRRPPTPLDLDNLPTSDVDGGESETDGIRDKRMWTIQECADVFCNCLSKLKSELEHSEKGDLVWDKDDECSMDFVTAVANIRSHIYGIPTKTRFDIKSMAGNIIPAIATTNAIIAGLLVMEGLKILTGNIENCRTVYLNRQPNPRKKLLVPCVLDKPNPKCYVCSYKPEVTVVLNTHKVTVKTLEEKIIKGQLNMVAPDVEIADGKGTILISSEPQETAPIHERLKSKLLNYSGVMPEPYADNADKFLSDFGIKNGSRFNCDDFLQEYELTINIAHRDKLEEEKEFEVVGDLSELQANEQKEKDKKEENGDENGRTSKENDDDDELMVVEEPDDVTIETAGTRKRKADDDLDFIQTKKAKVADSAAKIDDEDIIVL